MFPDQPTEPTLPPPAVPESNKAPETPKAPEAPQEGPRLTLVPPDDCPPPPDTPPEVAADVRAMFLEEEERQRAEETITIREGRPPLVTGIYRKPRPAAQQPLVMPLAPPSKPAAAPSPASRPVRPPVRPTPTPRPATPPTTWSPGRSAPEKQPSPAPTTLPAAPTGPSSPSPSLLSRLGGFFSGAPLGRKGVFGLLAAILLVAILAWWMGAPKTPAPQEPTLASAPPPATPEVPGLAESGGEQPSPLATAPTAPAAPTATAAPTAPSAPAAPAPAIPLSRIPGATITASADGSWLVRYDDPVFVSTDRISVEGMKALKATAAALLKLPKGAAVTIQGHTDDIPPSPNAQGPFRTNADLAAARAEVVQEHLTVFCKRQSRFAFTTSTTAPAPYPNDTDAHRRLNRTVTLLVAPVP